MFNGIKFSLFSTLIVIAIFGLPSKIAASQNEGLPKVIIQPGGISYSMKRIMEKFFYYVNLNVENKADYYRDLLQKRVAELNYIIDNRLLREHQQASERISFYAGKLADHIIANKLEGKKMEISELMKKDKALLANMRDKFPANSSFWMLVQHSINSLDMNLEKLEN